MKLDSLGNYYEMVFTQKPICDSLLVFNTFMLYFCAAASWQTSGVTGSPGPCSFLYNSTLPTQESSSLELVLVSCYTRQHAHLDCSLIQTCSPSLLMVTPQFSLSGLQSVHLPSLSWLTSQFVTKWGLTCSFFGCVSGHILLYVLF